MSKKGRRFNCSNKPIDYGDAKMPINPPTKYHEGTMGKKTRTLHTFIDLIAKDTGYQKQDIKQILRSYHNAIKKSFWQCNIVRIEQVCCLEVVRRAGCRHYNPQNKKRQRLPASVRVQCRISLPVKRLIRKLDPLKYRVISKESNYEVVEHADNRLITP